MRVITDETHERRGSFIEIVPKAFEFRGVMEAMRVVVIIAVAGACSTHPTGHYACTVDHFRDGANAGTPVCTPPPSCAMPVTGVSGSGEFCTTFELEVSSDAITWVGCFTCATSDDACVPSGHVTNPSTATFMVDENHARPSRTRRRRSGT
jgi:hypothetical protein